MKYILLLVILLTGCSHIPKAAENIECDKLAKYARSIDTLRVIGVSMNDLDNFTAEPAAVTFPFQQIKFAVYNTSAKTPAHTYVTFYTMCDEGGYNHMLRQLTVDHMARQDGESSVVLLPPQITKTTKPIKKLDASNYFRSTK